MPVGVKPTSIDVIMKKLLISDNFSTGAGTGVFEMRDTAKFVDPTYTVPLDMISPGSKPDLWLKFDVRADMLFAGGLIDPKVIVPYAVIAEQARITAALRDMDRIRKAFASQATKSGMSHGHALMLQALNLFSESLLSTTSTQTASAINAFASQILAQAQVRTLKEKSDLTPEQIQVIDDMNDPALAFDPSVVEWTYLDDNPRATETYFKDSSLPVNMLPFRHVSRPAMSAARIIAISVVADFLADHTKARGRQLPSVLLRNLSTLFPI
jgi:hypothetical protein